MELSFHRQIESTISSVCFHPNWKYISLICNKKDISIYYLNDYDSLTPITKLVKHRNDISSIDWSLLPENYSKDPSYSQLISIGSDRLVLLWLLKEQKINGSTNNEISSTKIETIKCFINYLQSDCYPISCKFSSSSLFSNFAISTNSGDIFLFNSRSRSATRKDDREKEVEFKELYIFEQLKIRISEFPLTCLVWSTDSKFLACGGLENKGIILHINNEITNTENNNENRDLNSSENFNLEILSTIDTHNAILCCAISPKNDQVIFSDKDSYIHFIKIDKGYEGINNILKWDGLPFCNIKFLDQKFVVAVGHDCIPVLFMQISPCMWSHLKTISSAIMPLYLDPQWQNSFNPMEHYNQNSVHKKPIIDVFVPNSNAIICFGSDGKYSLWKMDNKLSEKL